MSPEQALTTPGNGDNRYCPEAERRANPVKSYLLFGQTRPLSEGERLTIRNDPALLAKLEAARTAAPQLVKRVEEANQRVEARGREILAASSGVIISYRSGGPFGNIPTGETCVLRGCTGTWHDQSEYWVAVKVEGKPDHNALVLNASGLKYVSSLDTLVYVRKALLDNLYPVGPELLLIDGRVDDETAVLVASTREAADAPTPPVPSPEPAT